MFAALLLSCAADPSATFAVANRCPPKFAVENRCPVPCGCRCNLGGACECGPAGCPCSPCVCPNCKGRAARPGNVSTPPVFHSYAFPVTVGGVHYPAGTLFQGPTPATIPPPAPVAPGVPATYPLPPAYFGGFGGRACAGGS